MSSAELAQRVVNIKLRKPALDIKLALKAPITTAADDIFFIYFLFYSENKSWHFMWIVCNMKYQDLFSLNFFFFFFFVFWMSSATNFAWRFKG